MQKKPLRLRVALSELKKYAFPDRLHYEKLAVQAGHSMVGGIDEAGRGPLAGPVVAACVVLSEDKQGFEQLRDSKQLTAEKREELYPFIQEKAFGIGIGVVDAPMIDRLNILQATFLAMEKAVASLHCQPDFLLIDGNQRPPWAKAAQTIIAGDQLSLSISAASIIAKVTRDRLMEAYDRQYPQWGFAQHKGYGTPQHLQAIHEHGICDLHRRSYQPIKQLTFSVSWP